MPQFKYARHPDAKVFDDAGKEIQHLLWGDWVRVDQPAGADGRARVRARGCDGWMRASDLQDERLLEVVFTDVGQGDGCLIVTPADKHLVVDAGVGSNMFRFLSWRYMGFKSTWTFQSAIITHPDADHYAGFTPLFEHAHVRFDTVYHNGVMEEWSPELGPVRKVAGRKYLSHLVEDKAALESFLAQKQRWQKPKQGGGTSFKQYPKLLDTAARSGRVGDIRMLSVEHSDAGFLPGYGASKELSIRVLGPVVERDGGDPLLRAFGDTPQSTALDGGKTKNGHSIVLMLAYRDLRLLLGGDLNRPAEVFLLRHHGGLDHDYPWSSAEEQEIVAAAAPAFRADVAKSCHHGAADVTDAMLRAVNAAATVVSSGDEESHAHPRPETLGALGLFGRGRRPLIFSTELMRSTREDEGDARERIGSLRERIAQATNAEKKALLQAELDALVDRLAERNVTTYGAINLRTDGRKALMAYKLERPRTGGGRLTKWDLYRLERAGSAPFAYVPDGAGH